MLFSFSPLALRNPVPRHLNAALLTRSPLLLAHSVGLLALSFLSSSSLPYCCQCGHDLRNWNVLFESSAMQGRHISHSATLLVECYELSNSNSFLRQILTANIIVLSLSLLLLLPGAGRARRLLFPTYLTAAGRGGIEQQAGRLPGLDPLLALLARCCCPSLVESDRRRRAQSVSYSQCTLLFLVANWQMASPHQGRSKRMKLFQWKKDSSHAEPFGVLC